MVDRTTETIEVVEEVVGEITEVVVEEEVVGDLGTGNVRHVVIIVLHGKIRV